MDSSELTIQEMLIVDLLQFMGLSMDLTISVIFGLEQPISQERFLKILSERKVELMKMSRKDREQNILNILGELIKLEQR